MVERDVVLAKIAVIDRCLARIAEVRGRGAGLLPIDVEDLTVLSLTRAAQAAIDLATHVVNVLSDGLRRMVGFRNIAVHDYGTSDPRIVDSIAGQHLGDLRAFATCIAAHFGIA